MQDDREWVQVEVTWDEDLADASDDIEWDTRPWEHDPLYDPRPRPIYPALPPGFAYPARVPDRLPSAGGKRRDERARPKRQRADAQLSKRKRKKLRAWEIEDED